MVSVGVCLCVCVRVIVCAYACVFVPVWRGNGTKCVV